MSVTLFIQDHNGDNNGHIELPDRETAYHAVYWIQRQGGFWADGTLSVRDRGKYKIWRYDFWWNTPDTDLSVFVPLHRIDRMEIRA